MLGSGLGGVGLLGRHLGHLLFIEVVNVSVGQIHFDCGAWSFLFDEVQCWLVLTGTRCFEFVGEVNFWLHGFGRYFDRCLTLWFVDVFILPWARCNSHQIIFQEFVKVSIGSRFPRAGGPIPGGQFVLGIVLAWSNVVRLLSHLNSRVLREFSATGRVNFEFYSFVLVISGAGTFNQLILQSVLVVSARFAEFTHLSLRSVDGIVRLVNGVVLTWTNSGRSRKRVAFQYSARAQL